MAAIKPITAFRGPSQFLSNFYRVSRPIAIHGLGGGEIHCYTAEHAYQASKTLIREERLYVALLKTPGQAKAAGRKVKLRDGWEGIKVAMMFEAVRAKFKNNPELAAMLRKTGTTELIEGNTWGDTYWGVYNGVGENNLGIVLMQVRADLIHA